MSKELLKARVAKLRRQLPKDWFLTARGKRLYQLIKAAKAELAQAGGA